MADEVRLRQFLIRSSRSLAWLTIVGALLAVCVRVLGVWGTPLFPPIEAPISLLLCACAFAIRSSEPRTRAAVDKILPWTALAMGIGMLTYFFMGGYRADTNGFVLAPAAAVVVILAAGATLAIQRAQRFTLGQSLALLGLTICLLSLAGFVEGNGTVHGLGAALPMTVTSLTLLPLLCLSALWARPDKGPMEVVTSATSTGATARRVLVALVMLPFALNFLFRLEAQEPWARSELRNALFIITIMLTVVGLVWWHLLSLARLAAARKAEGGAEESEQSALLLQAVNDYAIYSLDREGRVSSWNTGAAGIKGYSEEEIIGAPFSVFFPADDVNANVPRGLLQKAKQNGKAMHEGWRLRKDGNRFYARSTLSRILGAYGQFEGYAEVCHDITTEKHMQDKRIKLESILNTALDPILVVDSEGRVENFNPAAEREFGYSASEVVGRFGSMLLTPADQTNALSLLLREGAFELNARRGDGSIFPAEVTVSAMEPPEGRKYTVIMRDIAERKEAENALRESEARLSLALEAGNVGVWDFDVTTGRIIASGPVYQMLPSAAMRSATTIDDRMSLMHPDDRVWLRERYERILSGQEDNFDVEFRMLTEAGDWEWVHSRGSATQKDEQGRPLRLYGTTTNIHQRKTIEEDLRNSKLDLEIALKDASFHLWHLHLQERRVIDLDMLIETLGYSRSPITENPAFWFSILHPDDQEALRSMTLLPLPPELTSSTSGMEIRLRGKDGEWHWMAVHARIMETDSSGEPLRIAGTCLDITERKRANERLLHAAQHDPLTGLPNRALTYAFGDRALAAAPRHENLCAVLFVDLDSFKPINDYYGHPAGDMVLREVAQRLKHCVRNEDIVGRLGGDEFLVVLSQVRSAEDVAHIATNCLTAISRPYNYKEVELHVSSSIGVSLFPNDGEDMETLVKHADAAMYQAKENGRNNLQFFTSTMNKRAKSLLALEGRVRRAVEAKAFKLHYQPVVDTESERVVGVEALLRWPAENISPDEFIPFVENNGLIGALGEWVMEEACRQLRSWSDQGLAPLCMSVNVSPLQLRQQRFAEHTINLVKKAGVEAHQLQLEITESSLVHDLKSVVRTLRALREAGFKIALDDFGKGYSSLNYLKNLPLDTVKIDRDFVHELAHDPVNLAITEAIITLGDSLGLEVIAEGVESEEVLQLLRTKHCRRMQGFHLGVPVPAKEFEQQWRNPPARQVYWH